MKKRCLSVSILFLCLLFSHSLFAEDQAEVIHKVNEMRKEAIGLFNKGKGGGEKGVVSIQKAGKILHEAISMLEPFPKENAEVNAVLEKLNSTLFWIKKFTPVNIYVYKSGEMGPKMTIAKKEPVETSGEKTDGTKASPAKKMKSEDEFLFQYASRYEKNHPENLEKITFLYTEFVSSFPKSPFAKKAKGRLAKIEEKKRSAELVAVEDQVKGAMTTWLSDLDKCLKYRNYEKIEENFKDAINSTSNLRVKNRLEKESLRYVQLCRFKKELIELFKTNDIAIDPSRVDMRSPGKIVGVTSRGITIECNGQVTMPWTMISDQGFAQLGQYVGDGEMLTKPEYGIIATELNCYELAVSVFENVLFGKPDETENIEPWLIRAIDGYKVVKTTQIDSEIDRARRLFDANRDVMAMKVLMTLIKDHSRNQFLRDKVEEVRVVLKQMSQG